MAETNSRLDRIEKLLEQQGLEQRALTKNLNHLQQTVELLSQEQRAVTKNINQLQQTVGILVSDRSFSLEAMGAVWLPSYLEKVHHIKTNGAAKTVADSAGITLVSPVPHVF